jgi:hypothetical protein
VEKKLDRVLEALERLSRTPTPPLDDVSPAASVEGRPPSGGDGPVAVDTPEPPASDSPDVPPAAEPPPPGDENKLPPSDSAGSPDSLKLVLSRTRHAPLPLADRLQNLEKQMQSVIQRLDRLEARLKSLDARVGGSEIENLQVPPTTPTP